jgi:hypothetical protein
MPVDLPHTAVPPRRAAPSARPRCQGCGRTAAELVRALPPGRRTAALEQATGDLACRWLLPQRSRWTEARFCHGCAPVDNRWPIECAVCRNGDGPIMILSEPHPVLPGMPDDRRARAEAVKYLHRHGWSRSQHGLVCPGCTR